MVHADKELVSFRFERTLKQQLADLATATGRSQTFLAEEAIRQYCDLQSWQVAAIQEGISAADAGEVIPHDQIKRKWEKKFANLLDASR
jgi:predicted transcriptional regulator